MFVIVDYFCSKYKIFVYRHVVVSFQNQKPNYCINFLEYMTISNKVFDFNAVKSSKIECRLITKYNSLRYRYILCVTDIYNYL